jgi:hypothetical protein
MKTLLFLIIIVTAFAQTETAWFYFMINIPHTEKYATADSVTEKSQNVRIGFWNIENLYDPYDDTTKLDDEFTAQGIRRWRYSRFNVKLNHLAKTIIAMGGWTPPAIVGLCEVENRYVLNKLIYQTPLASLKYKFIHHESPDLRGIDVALLYRPEMFGVLNSRSVRISFPFDTLAQTREILMVSGTLFGTDTLTLFVNHWPSRRGGSLESQPRRNHVAAILHNLIDSVIARQPLANILIMGDFNDEPKDESVSKVLGAAADPTQTDSALLVNLMGPVYGRDGTHKFQGNWAVLDQFIVTKPLLTGAGRLITGYRAVRIFKPEFILKEDSRFFGSKPSRTFNGPKYEGGFSDHLPVYLDIRRMER